MPKSRTPDRTARRTARRTAPPKAAKSVRQSRPDAPVFIGVDVAKAEVVTACNGQTQTVPNTKTDLKRWLRTLPANCHIAMESTGGYHVALADLATTTGHTVYVINPKQIKHYRK